MRFVKSICRLLASISLAAMLAGCASYPVNAPLETIDAEVGYRLNNRTLGEKNSDELYVILGLSGGGIRAVALDYGVIAFLDRVRFSEDDRSLLDEVDMISTSSAASIPAAYYGLYGKEAFLRDFPRDVLARPIQSDLVKRMLNPLHWPRLASGTFSRGDLAAEYFDRTLFHGLTFADMRRERPLIVLNSTDIGIGSQLAFVQHHFDLLCSNLSPYPVARAVTASLAFTPAFTAITLKNYNGSRCGYATPAWARHALQVGAEADPFVYAAARDLVSYENADKRPYIHLLDSGISDNIGIRTPALAFSLRDSPAGLVQQLEEGIIKKLAIILVNAKPKTDFKGDLKPKPPNAIAAVNLAASSPLANYSYETVNVLRSAIDGSRAEIAQYGKTRDRCSAQAETACAELGLGASCSKQVENTCFEAFSVADAEPPAELDLYLVHVSFDLIDDQSSRERFESIPTTLQLPKADVDALIEIAPLLMQEEPEFRHLVKDLDARIANAP